MKELTPDLYFLFREGMELRLKDAVEIFGTKDLHLKYPDLIYKTTRSTLRGSAYLHDLLPMENEYDPQRFIEKAPNLYTYIYKDNKKPNAKFLNRIPLVDGKTQDYHGFMSGILKYNKSNFYFDPEGISQLKLYEQQEENCK